MCGDDEALPPASRGGEDFPWHLGVFDAHNHIGERVSSAEHIPGMKARCVAIMATRSQDQHIVASIAESMGASGDDYMIHHGGPCRVIPGFGRHPWFSHELYNDLAATPSICEDEAKRDREAAKSDHYAKILSPLPEPEFIADLPTPTPLSTFIDETRSRLKAHPLAMVGEIGLDKAFRLPSKWTPETREAAAADPSRTPGGRRRRPLSKHSISIEHQKIVLLAHLRLAGEMGRAANIHGVQVHGMLFDLLVGSWKGHEKTRKDRKQSRDYSGQTLDEGLAFPPFPPRICLHSFSGKSEAVRQYLNPRFPSTIFFSFSRTNNLRDDIGRKKMEDALKMVPDDRLLLETDIHTAGAQMDADLEYVYRAVFSLKGWGLEEGVKIILHNWQHFVFGRRVYTNERDMSVHQLKALGLEQ